MNAHEVDEYEAETDGKACEVVCRSVSLRCSAQYYEYEKHGEHNLNDESVGCAIGTCVCTCCCGNDG